ncbi:DUF3060 domain-containing protein [Roseomonas sp. OT10]|uniref:DUF3060 domain-containing protein n=1 Tax=Roseomonas cutis TaxID=2897332 RepID=UPI001E3870A6|nr:DUF3060 domain-containing protein [Roseomonas sp. OT10]UFN48588.1 DUF3060 domain-containing protein [Roseomonas sp. OT10]
MTRYGGMLTLLAVLAAAPATAQTLELRGNGQEAEQDCAGRDVLVRGDGNRLTLRQGCRSLNVEGQRNRIEAELADGADVEVRGDGNRIAYRTLPGEAIGRQLVEGQDSRIEASGPDAAMPRGGPPLSIAGDGLRQQSDCAGRDVTVRGNRLDVELRGGCRSLRVEGQSSEVRAELEPGAKVTLRGNALRLLWRLSAPGPEPVIDGQGQAMDVRRAG